MSQYPSPYSGPQSFPQGYSHPYESYLAPARRVGLLMIVLGSLMALYGACNGSVAMLVPAEQLMQQNRAFSGVDAPQLPIQAMRVTGVIFSLVFLLLGIAQIATAIPIRRGSGTAAVVGIIVAANVVVLLGILILMSLVAALAQPLLLVATLALLIPLGLFVLQIVWLIQARRAAGQIKNMQAQYQQQYWQYQQQQQTYGYGYAQPPAAQPDVTPTQPIPPTPADGRPDGPSSKP